MLKEIATVFRFEFVQQFRKKSFLISTIIIAVLIALGVCLPVICAPLFTGADSGFGGTSSGILSGLSAGDDESGHVLPGGVVFEDESLRISLPFADDQIYADEDALEKAIQNGDISIGFVIRDVTHMKTIYASFGINSSTEEANQLSELLRQVAIAQKLEPYGVSAADYQDMESTVIDNETVVLGKDTTSQYIAGLLFVILVYLVILLNGQIVSTSIAREKDNRTMELLITTVRPDALILGKVFALLAVIVITLGLYLACAAVPYELLHTSYPAIVTQVLNLLFSVSQLGIYILYFFIGLVLYMFLYAALGSTVSRVEDVSSALTPLMLFVIIGYFLAFMQMSGMNNSALNAVSWFPFFSILMMPIRYANDTIGFAGLMTSAAIDILCACFMAWVSIRIYRWGSLNYGNKPGLSSVLKAVFPKK